MKTCWLLALMACTALVAGCNAGDTARTEKDGVGPGELEKWNDPNFKIIPVSAINYTDYDIYSVFIMPPDKNDIDYAARTTGGRAVPRDAQRWSMSGSGPDLAWDKRWTTPRKFKVWWERVVDYELLRKSGPYPKDGGMYDPFDQYTTKQTRPGSAWCESEVEIKEQFGQSFGPPYTQRYRHDMVLYFFPDGTVKGHLEFGADSEIERVDIAKRDELPTLKDRPCLKVVPNPFFGKKRPISIN